MTFIFIFVLLILAECMLASYRLQRNYHDLHSYEEVIFLYAINEKFIK